MTCRHEENRSYREKNKRILTAEYKNNITAQKNGAGFSSLLRFWLYRFPGGYNPLFSFTGSGRYQRKNLRMDRIRS